jgi:hypothetical protein
MLGVGSPIALQMIKTLLDLLVDNARAEISETTGTAVTEAVQKGIAPFAFTVHVVCVSLFRTPRDIRVHALLRRRLLLAWVALRRRAALFSIALLWDRRALRS